MVTFALGTTAPEGSVTVPDRVAVATWARTAGATSRMIVKIPTPNPVAFHFNFIRISSWLLRTAWGRKLAAVGLGLPTIRPGGHRGKARLRSVGISDSAPILQERDHPFRPWPAQRVSGGHLSRL